MGGVSDASRALAAAGRQHRLRFLASVPLTSVLFGGKFLSAYLAARALGVEAPFTDLILAQIFLHILLYFFPTPGGAGGAEAGAALVMSRFIPAELLPAYTVLWRAATMYLSVLVGGIILVGHLRRELS